MKKVINITISGFVFAIEEDAYKTLSDYLDDIKRHFGKDKDGDEIVEDIEGGIAEKFLARKKKELSVSMADVEAVIDQMGTLKDFKKLEEDEVEDGDDEREEKDAKDAKGGKKLYRDPDDVMIAGVASGLAAYFGIETVIVRVAFVILLFVWGLAIPLYLVLWLVMPMAESRVQKLEMRGERITLKEIEKSVKKGVENLKKKPAFQEGANKVKGFFHEFFNGLGRVVRVIFRVIAVVFGVFFVAIGWSGIFAMTFVLVWHLAGSGIPYTDVTLNDFVNLSANREWIFAVSLYVLALVPFLYCTFIGLGLVRKKAEVGVLGLISLAVLWFAAASFVTSVVFENRDLIEAKFQELDEDWDEAEDLKGDDVYFDEFDEIEDIEMPASRQDREVIQ